MGGPWMQPAKEILEGKAAEWGLQVQVIPIKFGYYDVLSFLAPFDRTVRPYRILLQSYEDAIEHQPDARVSIVAHSFGTYLVGKLLRENRRVRLHRLLLCGSVLDQGFKWAVVAERFDDAPLAQRDRVRNECGTRDIWPILAKVANARYGDAGRHGFENEVYAQTFHFDGYHSLFFEETHIRNEWVQFLLEGVNRKGNATAPGATPLERVASWPFVTLFLRLLVVYPLWFILYYWWMILFISIVCAAGLWYFPAKPADVDRGRTIGLAKYFEDLRAKKADRDPERLQDYLNDLKGSDSATVNCEGAIVEIGADPDAYGFRKLVFQPKDCGVIRSSTDRLTVTFAEALLPPGVDFTALQPNGTGYQVAEVVAEIENISWSEIKKEWRIYASGKAIKLLTPVDCPE